MNSDSKTIIIAGAGKGLGRQIAYDAAKLGYHLALISRNSGDLIELEKEIPNTTIYPIDLTSYSDVNTAFKNIRLNHEKIYSLINCAATWTGNRSIYEISDIYMEDSLRLNFSSAFNTVKAMLEHLPDRLSDPCNIMNIGATASLRGSKNCSAFTSAKGALRQFSQSIAKELGPKKIHVSHLVIDGLLDNERTRALNPNMEDEFFINMASLSKNIFHILSQDKSCWTFELDVRPYNEKW